MKYFARICLAFLLSLSLVFIPINTQAETLADYQKKLKEAQDAYNQNQSEINETNEAIQNNEEEIAYIKNQFNVMADEIETMKQEIVDYNVEINEKTLETKELFEYLQIANGENAYLEYAFGADTITDFIYRMSIAEQMAEYNEKTIEELQDMIEENHRRQEELEKKEQEMTVRKAQLEDRIEALVGQRQSLSDLSVSRAEEVRIQQEYVDFLVNQGCEANDVIGVDCATTNVAGVFRRPVDYGYVTSEFGYRWGSLHRAIDISNKDPYNTRIYPVANGTISAIYYDLYGALVVVVEHRTASGDYYSSLYAHLSRFAPGIKVGQKVTTNDYIGYMGATGNVTGPHLHLEIAPCRLYNVTDKNCGSWDKYVAYVKKIYDNGTFSGPRELISLPNTWVTFSGR